MNHPKTIFILTISFAYAILRYHIFNEVSWAQFPLFISNKAISMSGLIFLGLALVQKDRPNRKSMGQFGAALIVIHILISFLIMNKHYFAKFFTESGEMTFQAEVSMLAGIVATIFMGALLLNSQHPAEKKETKNLSLKLGWGRAILILAAIHLVFMGYTSWFTLALWPGYLPPITSISFIIALYFLFRRRKSSTE